MKNKLKRRDFIRNMSLLGLGCGSGIIEGKLKLIDEALAVNTSSLNDQKTLVCVFLFGGNDSFNMIVPNTTRAYNEYATTRQGLAIPRHSLIDVGDQYAFHPNMADVARIYNGGDIALMLNVGPLGQPLKRSEVSLDSTLEPQNLFSHNHQQEIWQKAAGGRNPANIRAGWGGIIADELAGANNSTSDVAIPPSFSINGYNIWQVGEAVTSQDVHSLNGINLSYWQRYNTDFHDGIWQRVLNDGARSKNILTREITKRMETVSERAYPLSETTAATTAFDERLFDTPVSTPLSDQLKMAARLIHSRETLGQQRQIIFVGLGGWDTHSDQAGRHPLLVSALNHGLNAFNQAMQQLGTHDSTTLFTISDFGRTLTINGDGTDHGWGGHHMVMGGAVQGGIYGQSPSLIIGGDDDYPDNSGRIIPTLSESQYAGAVSKWMGLTEDDVNRIFPDLANFNSGSGWEAPVRLFG